MKKLIFNLVLVCSFALVTLSCSHRDDATEPVVENLSNQEMKYTTCPVVNSSADYTSTTFDINWSSYTMAPNKLLRVKKSMTFDNSKPMSAQVYTTSGTAKARMYIKVGTNIIAFSACTNVTSTTQTMVSSINVPTGATEIWLEFYSDAGVTVNYYRMPQ